MGNELSHEESAPVSNETVQYYRNTSQSTEPGYHSHSLQKSMNPKAAQIMSGLDPAASSPEVDDLEVGEIKTEWSGMETADQTDGKSVEGEAYHDSDFDDDFGHKIDNDADEKFDVESNGDSESDVDEDDILGAEAVIPHQSIEDDDGEYDSCDDNATPVAPKRSRGLDDYELPVKRPKLSMALEGAETGLRSSRSSVSTSPAPSSSTVSNDELMTWPKLEYFCNSDESITYEQLTIYELRVMDYASRVNAGAIPVRVIHDIIKHVNPTLLDAEQELAVAKELNEKLQDEYAGYTERAIARQQEIARGHAKEVEFYKARLDELEVKYERKAKKLSNYMVKMARKLGVEDDLVEGLTAKSGNAVSEQASAAAAA